MTPALVVGIAGVACMAGLLAYALADHWWRMARQSFELSEILKRHGRDRQAASEETVYRIFRDKPDDGSSSYLHVHYRRGLLGSREPQGTQPYARAAWRAGRDAATQDPPKA